VTNGLNSASSGGTAMAMNTTAAIAREPWRPSRASAVDAAAKSGIQAASLGALWKGVTTHL